MSAVVLWDFDGTLAERPGLWSQCMVDILDDHEPGHGVVRDDLRPALKGRFPWGRPDQPHGFVDDPDGWWQALQPMLLGAYCAAGLAEQRAAELAALVRERFVDPAAWRVFDDTVAVLSDLRDAGWRHVIVSNHVPELAALVDALGFGHLVDHVVTSALVGHDKPHPAIFSHALRLAGAPTRRWMVGDDAEADVAGAEALGIPAILVRTHGRAARRSADLRGAARLILAG